MTSNVEIWGAVTALVSVAVLLLEYLKTRTPSQQINDRFDKIEERAGKDGARITTLENWKNS